MGRLRLAYQFIVVIRLFSQREQAGQGIPYLRRIYLAPTQELPRELRLHKIMTPLGTSATWMHSRLH